MSKPKSFLSLVRSSCCCRRRRSRLCAVAITFAALLLVCDSPPARAATWNGIEPLKSRRADVERVLGRPSEDVPGQTATLHFKVIGGTVTVSFFNSKFVTSRKLAPEIEGTVMQIVLQHDHASDTPESLKLVKNSRFERETKQNVAVFTNQKDGIVYTFIDGKLKNTYFSASAEQLARLQRKR